MTETGTESRSADQIQKIIDSVRRRFTVTQEYLREGEALEFYVDPNEKDTKTKFVSLIDDLKQTGDSAVFRKTDHGLLLMVFRKPVFGKPKLRTPLILLSATLITILVDGFLRASGYSDPVFRRIAFGNIIEMSIIYTIALIGIIGIHEMGHKTASWFHKMDSSWPYFIPGIPYIWPTFGAVISSREPPVNKDSLFDLGLSGPVAGLAVTIIVSIAAIYTAVLVPSTVFPPGTPFSNTDLYTTWLINLIKSPPSQDVIVGPQFFLLYFAYSVGFLLTFVNLLPAWQLDGGHIANAAVSPRVHRWLTYASAAVMILIGAWTLAFLVLLLSSRMPSMRPLDDVSPLSKNRKILFVLVWVLAAAIYAFVIYNNSFFGFNQFFSH